MDGVKENFPYYCRERGVVSARLSCVRLDGRAKLTSNSPDDVADDFQGLR